MFLDQQFLDEIVSIRRNLHQYPELGFEEFRTSSLITDYLSKIKGIEVHTGIAKTGVIGLIKCPNVSKKAPLALRADIDALPIFEETELQYSSKNKGIMHACGHDGHTAALLGAAKWLSENRDKLNRDVVFIFQPSEEKGAGGKVMCDEGIIENFNISEIYAFHNMPGINVGCVALANTVAMSALDNLTIEIKGKGCHGALPHLGVDPILIASNIIQSLQFFNSRAIESHESIVLTFGSINGGDAKNVIPDSVKITGTLRTLNSAIRKDLFVRIPEMIDKIAIAFGGTAKCEIAEGYPSVVNKEENSKIVLNIAKNLLGESNVSFPIKPFMFSEDFAYYLEKTSGAYYFIGNGDTPSLHSSKYNFNDNILDTAIKMHCSIACS